MKLSKNIGASRALMIAVIAVCLLGGGARSVKKEARKAQKLFFTAGDHDQSAQADYAGRIAQCANLQVVAGRYLADGDPALTGLAAATESAQTALEKTDITKMATANTAMATALTQTVLALQGEALSETDLTYVAGLQTNFESLGYTLRHNEYNTRAAAFNQNVRGAFPGRVWAALFRIDALPLF